MVSSLGGLAHICTVEENN